MTIYSCGKQLLAVNLLIFGFGLQPVYAEVVLDGSLGQSGALSGPDYAITESLGQVQGTNLFHSFSDFNLNNTESATFSGSASITNVISRVTGGNASSIDGTLRSTISGADFYFINPNGVVFGENASLDVSGSFYATTADYVNLGSDGRFDATQPGNSVLTASSPSAFGFLDSSVSSITVSGSHLAVTSGRTLGLVGGAIDISGADAAFEYLVGPWTLSAPSGRVELISVASTGEVTLTSNGPDTASISQLGDISLHNAATVSTVGDPGGTIYVRSNNLQVESSYLSSSSTGVTDHPGLGFDIAVTNEVNLRIGQSGNRVNPEFTSNSNDQGDAGGVQIVAGRLTLTGDVSAVDPENNLFGYAMIQSTAQAGGDSGQINIDAEEIILGENALILTETNSTGNANDILINVGSLSINGATGGGTYISSSAYIVGDGGNIQINANEIDIKGGASGFVGISSQVGDSSSASASSGDIDISVQQLTVLDGGQINASIFGGAGKAGDINIQSGDILIAGANSGGYSAGIFSDTSGWMTSGAGGNINIAADNILMERSGRISTNSFSFGQAGNVVITADSIRMYGGGDEVYNSTAILAASGWVGLGGGNVDINAGSLELYDGAEIGTFTVGWGDGGVVTINADELFLSGMDEFINTSSQITASTYEFYYPSYATGDGGSIFINAGNIHVTDQAAITAFSDSAGNGGDVTIHAINIKLSDNGQINSASTQTGQAGDLFLTADDSIIIDNASVTTSALQSDGGDITIRAQQLLYLNEGSITTSVQGGSGNGGNIDIDPIFVVLNHSNITADAQGGNGGNITVVADYFLASPDSTLSASSNLGVDGSIVVDAPNKDFGGELEAVPDATEDASKLFRNDCVAVGSGFSSFVTAKGGPAVGGSRIFILSVYHPVQKVMPLKQDSRITQRPGKRKPLLVLAKKGVDCMGKHL